MNLDYSPGPSVKGKYELVDGLYRGVVLYSWRGAMLATVGYELTEEEISDWLITTSQLQVASIHLVAPDMAARATLH